MGISFNKIITLKKWLHKNGHMAEAHSLSALLKKEAISSGITLEELRAEFPEVNPNVLSLPSGRVLTQRDVEKLKKIYPSIEETEAALGKPVDEGSEGSSPTPSSSGQRPVDVENKILNQGFSLKHTDTTNVDMSFVADIQRLLNSKGLNGPVNGNFDVNTKNLILKFQAANRFQQNGEINKETLDGLRSPSTKGFSGQTEGASSTDSEDSGLEAEDKFVVSKPGLGETLRSRNTPERVPSRTAESGEIFASKFSFVEEPCLNCAAMAIQESKDNWDNGNISEKDPRAEETIMEYFRYSSKNNSWKQNIDRWGFEGKRRYGPRAGEHQMNPVKTRDANGVATDWYHWSAVFTSFIMGHHDGEGAKWFVSEAHTPYIEAYQKKRREIERDPEGHKDKMFYVWFTKEEMDRLGMKPEPGDLVGTKKHCDIYIGNGQMIGGNTCAKSEYTGGKTKNCKGTSGPQPIKWKSGSGIIKRVRVTGPGKNRAMV